MPLRFGSVIWLGKSLIAQVSAEQSPR